MKAVLRYLKPSSGRMAVGLTLKFIGTLADLAIPMILSFILNDIVKTEEIRTIVLWGGIMALCAVVAFATNLTANRMASAVARDTTRALRHDLFSKISALSARQVDRFTIPSLESRLTSDTYYINQILNVIQRMGLRAPILLIGGIGVTMAFEPMLSLVMVAILPFITLAVWLISRKGIPMYRDLQLTTDRMIRSVRENVTGIRVIKALSRSEQEKEKFSKVNRTVSDKEVRTGVIMGITSPAMTILLNLGMVLVILAGAFRVNAGKAEPGTIIAFLSYFTLILNAMIAITRIFVMYSRASASADRIFEVLNTPPDLEVIPAEPVDEEEHIVFDHVGFSYLGKSENISNLSFRLKKGETLGIIGATGSGKTTVINLLMRLYEKDSGSIRISGREVSSIPPEILHTMFGVVFQNDAVFADTIYGNIDFGRNIPREQIIKAAECAQASEFIDALPDGYEHHVTSRGTNLSGGQKQRLLLARALAGQAQILIFDDSSSALDYKTDSLLRKALRENYSGVSSIIIAQRVSSVLHADHILVLEDGRTIGYGTHDELMASCGVYREISESQMGGDFG